MPNSVAESESSTVPPSDFSSLGAVAPNEQLIEQQGRYMRLAADFDNFRKRTQREMAKQSAAEKNSFIHDLLPILDNLERALACDDANSSGQLHDGVEMTLRQLSQLLARHGIEAVTDVGQPFDPHRHDAICLQNDLSKPDHSVLDVTQRGYCCGDAVFRPASVIVNDWSHSSGVPHAG